MSAGKRYKFQGTHVQVSIGQGAPKNITAIEVDTEGVPLLTSNAHGFGLGEVVLVDAVGGMTELNGNLYPVDNPAANDFELAGVDASGYTPYTSGGTATPLTYSEFCELTGVDQQDGTADEIEATTICSTAKEFEIGLSDSGTLTLNYNFVPKSTIQTAFRQAKKTGDDVAVRIVLPGDGGTVVLIGNVQQSSFTGANGALWTGTTTLKLTGEIFVL